MGTSGEVVRRSEKMDCEHLGQCQVKKREC